MRQAGTWQPAQRRPDARDQSLDYLRAARSGIRPWGGPAGSCYSWQQRYESHRVIRLLMDTARRFVDDRQELYATIVAAPASQREHHAPAHSEIGEQRGWNFPRRGSNDDAIDGKFLAQPGRAVAMLDADVAELERAQIAPR